MKINVKKSAMLLAIAVAMAATAGFLISLTPTRVFAQNKPALDLAVFPPTAYLHVKPDRTISHRVILQHTGTLPMHITPTVVDFAADGETGIPQLQDHLSFSSISLLNPGKKLGDSFRIEPNSKYEFVFTINPEPNIVEQEYHLAILLKAEPAPGIVGSDTGAAASGVVVSNLILVVSDSADDKGKIEIQKFPMPRLVDSFWHLKIGVLAENTGTTATVPKGTITIHHWQGRKVADWFIFPDVILAKSTRLLRATKTDPLVVVDGETSPKIIPMVYDEPFLIGPYTVTTKLEAADGSIQQHTITVFALPFSILAGVLLIVTLYLVYRYGNRLLTERRW